jgi:hypothetical protein
MHSLILPYLLLVTFTTVPMKNFDVDKIRAIGMSPYNGIAVRLMYQYDTQLISPSDFASQIAWMKKQTNKQIWPWVFFNRFVGFDKDSRASSKESDHPYFRRIKTIDLENKAGAVEDFCFIWETALVVAKELGSPGVVVDPEAYNNKNVHNFDYLVKRTGKSREEIQNLMRAIGARLADIVNETYPEAVIWSLFTGLDSLNTLSFPSLTKGQEPFAYVFLGMLEQCKKNNYRMTLISGGESTGYCFKSLQDLKHIMERRQEAFKSYVASYPNLKLAGTITPCDKVESKTSWLVGYKKCFESELKGLEDFKPLISAMLNSYGYVWIYAAGASGYNPYDSTSAAPYNKSLADCLSDSKQKTEAGTRAIQAAGTEVVR